LQRTRDFDENNEKKEDKEDIKEDYQTDSTENHKHVDSTTKFNHVTLQA